MARDIERPGWADRPYLIKATHSLGRWHLLFTTENPEHGDEPMQAVFPGWLTVAEMGSVLDAINLETNHQCQNVAAVKADLAAIRAGGIIALPDVPRAIRAARQAQGEATHTH